MKMGQNRGEITGQKVMFRRDRGKIMRQKVILGQRRVENCGVDYVGPPIFAG